MTTPLPVREDFLDFDTAWRIARAGINHTDPRCSYIQTEGGLLCDCGAIQTEWARLVAEQQAAPAEVAAEVYSTLQPRKDQP